MAPTNKFASLSSSVIFFILPVAVLGLLAIALFFDFLGAQATEIAKLINEIEIQCKADFWNSVGSMPALDPLVTGNSVCSVYLPKVLLFFFLLAVWCMIANLVTLKLFEAVQPRGLRFFIAAAVTVLLPAILLYKYLSVIPLGTMLSSFPAFAVLVVVETIILQAMFAFRFFKRDDYTPGPNTILAIFIASIAVFVVASLMFAYYPANLFNYIGSINTIVLYLLLAYAFIGGLFYYGRATGVPIAGLLLIWAVALNLLGLNDSHTVPTRELAASTIKGDQQFVSWLDARRDLPAFAGREYPVYIVASAGGGIYASIRTAYFLDFLQKKCPAFAHHIFAISGVSGGGLGALAFASQQQSLERPDLSNCQDDIATGPQKGYQPAPILDDFFSKDLISTIVGAGLFPDMLQRVLPWPVLELDRSQAFRKALGENWRAALDKTADRAPSLLRKGAPPAGACPTLDYFGDCEINTYWTPAGDVPILIFNATEVDTGSPVVLSNLDPKFYATSLAARNSPSFEDKSIHLIDGASLSARFPIALPAGFLSGFGGSGRIRLVDGGYFDGSGLAVAQAIKPELEAAASRAGRSVRVRIIFLGEKVPSIYDLMAMNQQQAASITMAPADLPRGAEISAHIKALLQARDQRSAETLRQVFKTDQTVLGFQWDPTIPGSTTTPCSNIPLAWYLAPCTQRVLKERLQNAVLESPDAFRTLREELSPR